jgi:hypothetical protein
MELRRLPNRPAPRSVHASTPVHPTVAGRQDRMGDEIVSCLQRSVEDCRLRSTRWDTRGVLPFRLDRQRRWCRYTGMVRLHTLL